MKNSDKQQYSIPMEVTPEYISACGIDPHSVIRTKIGERTVTAILVECSKEVYDAYMQPLWREDKRQQRERRCRISNRFGNVVMCTGDCAKCEKDRQREVISYEGLIDGGYDPADTTESLEDTVLEQMGIAELLRALEELTPAQRHITDMIGRGMTDRQMAAELGISQSTFSYQKRKLLEQLKKKLS